MAKKLEAAASKTPAYWATMSKEELVKVLTEGVYIDPSPQSDDWLEGTRHAFRKAVLALGQGTLPSIEALRGHTVRLVDGKLITSCTSDNDFWEE